MSESLTKESVAPPLRRVMRDCRRLYAAAAKLMIDRHPTLLDRTPGEFETLMDDLHRGLLIKVYSLTVRSDGRWSPMEKHIGAMLIEHLWDRPLRGSELREAAEGLFARSDQLRWDALLAPFARYEPLRDLIGQVETIASRLANLIVKSDGVTTPEETLTLHEIRSEISRVLGHRGMNGSFRDVCPDTGVLQVPGERTASETGAAAPRRGADKNGRTDGEGDADDAQRLSDAIKELESLVGLTEVKQRVTSLSNFLMLQRKRQKKGLATMPISLHMAFVGNPGTGKTTVARIVGQILGAMGILKSGHLVETDRSGLVAQYAGQTAVKTNTLCDSALDGVLFIDEAYSLVDSSGDDSYGREAIQTLLKRMEDNRDRLVVILAGYSDEMDQMIRSNPGLCSRINTRIMFPDFSPAELGRIFELLCRRNDYVLPAASRHRLLVAFDDAYRRRDHHFGNGRLSRNAFEDSVRKLADRIAGIVPLTEELMTNLMPEDINVPGLDSAAIDAMISSEHVLRVHCTKCDKRLRVRPELLGRTLRCPGCRKRFAAPWAEVDRAEER